MIAPVTKAATLETALRPGHVRERRDLSLAPLGIIAPFLMRPPQLAASLIRSNKSGATRHGYLFSPSPFAKSQEERKHFVR